MTKLACQASVVLLVLALANRSAAQDPSWTEPFEPFRVAGNLYHVGTRGVSSFLVLRELKPDMFVAQHPGMFRMEEKVRRLTAGEANPFFDPQGYQTLVAASLQAYLAQLKREQGK